MKLHSTLWTGAALAFDNALDTPAAGAAIPAARRDAGPDGAAVLPPLEPVGKLAFCSGGLGDTQSAAFREAMAGYPLALEFARAAANGNDHLADVPVTITDARGLPLLSTRATGPYMLVSIPDGRYTVSAYYHGATQIRTVDVDAQRNARETFVWPM